MICPVCLFNEEKEEEKFIGIFPAGSMLKDTKGNKCGIYACPKCKTVQYTNDSEYINKRKSEYINLMKAEKPTVVVTSNHDS